MSSGPDHVAPRQDEGDEDRRIKYSRDSLLCLRGAASEACRDKLPAGIVACRKEVEAALITASNADCRFGDNCRFLHHIPSSSHEQAAVGKKMNLKLGSRRPSSSTGTYAYYANYSQETPLQEPRHTGRVQLGDRCHLAHGDGELGKPMGPGSSFKTRLCVSFVTSGSCAFGRKCHFAHGKDELRSSPDAESE